MPVTILTYSIASESSKNLARSFMYTDGVDANRISVASSVYRKLLNNTYPKPSRNTTFIKWGNVPLNSESFQNQENVLGLNMTNLSWCTNKRSFFEKVSGVVRTPTVFYSTWQALTYLNSMNPGNVDTPAPILVERRTLSGTNGDGIVLCSKAEHISVTGKLWTVYVKKHSEYRCHIVRGPAGSPTMFWQQKKLRKNVEEDIPNRFQIRNWKNGWVYSTQNITIPNKVREVADRFYNAFMADGNLDFIALDIIFNKQSNLAYLLEGNTAPGIEGSTAAFYSSAFTDLVLNHNWKQNTYKRKEDVSLSYLNSIPLYDTSADEDLN